MWAKVLAGVLAAVSVAGVGVYVALPPGHCTSSCPLSARQVGVRSLTPTNQPVSAEQNDALAACAGGMAVSASAQPTICRVGGCCAE